MQPIALPKRGAFSLTKAEKDRLQHLAPIFGLNFMEDSDDLFVIRDLRTGNHIARMLPSEVAYRRLLTEICSRSAKWIYFHFEESCRDTLLQQSDARLGRIAELYSRDVITTPVETGNISRICIHHNDSAFQRQIQH